MGGKSNGGSSAELEKLRNPRAAGATAASSAQPNLQTQEFSAFHPGHLGLLAKQLNAGFGGGVSAQKGLLNQVHSGVNLPILNGAIDMKALEKTLAPAKPKPELDPNEERPDMTPAGLYFF